MKKLVSLLVAILMVTAVFCTTAGAEDIVSVTNALDNCEGLAGSLIAADGGTVNMNDPAGQKGKSLKINTQNAAYGLNGDPEKPDKYSTSWNGSRRTKLMSFDDGKTLQPGTYTVSIYVYESGNHLGSQLSHVSEIALSLHTAEETDETLAYNHANYDLIKLFKADASDKTNSFTASGVTQKVGTRTWGQYTAEVTITETVSQFAFWLMIDGDIGEMATISTWIDNLSIYNEAGAPEVDNTPTDENTPTDTPNDNTNNNNNNTTETTPADNDTEATAEATGDDLGAAEEEGCGAAIGAASYLVLIATVTAAGSMLRKKKKD